MNSIQAYYTKIYQSLLQMVGEVEMLVSQNNIAEAFQRLRQYDDALEDDTMINIHRNWRQLEADSLKGILYHDQESVEGNRAVHKFLSLLNQLKADYDPARKHFPVNVVYGTQLDLKHMMADQRPTAVMNGLYQLTLAAKSLCWMWDIGYDQIPCAKLWPFVERTYGFGGQCDGTD